MPEIVYADMHCDTMSLCAEKGEELEEKINNLKYGGCAAQCFAIFTQGDGAAHSFLKQLKIFKDGAKGFKVILNSNDLEFCIEKNVLGGILTVENLGFIREISELNILKKENVKMASLVWNEENGFAYSNGYMRERRGLKPLGREALNYLDENKIIVDLSHLSDGGADEILLNRKIPVAASHSDAARVCGVSRNLKDGQIKKIADCGGVVGVNFYKKFLGAGDTFSQVEKHIRHIVNCGGEDIIAIGSDFDGMTPPDDLKSPKDMPALFKYLEKCFSPRLIEKFAYKNFLRVFKEVCG